MKYVKEEEVLDRHGEKIPIPEVKVGLLSKESFTVGAFCYLILDAYMPSQEFRLTYKELKIKDKILNLLDGEPTKDGYWEFEDADFEILQKIVTQLGPTFLLLAKYIPRVGEKLENALSKLPS